MHSSGQLNKPAEALESHINQHTEQILARIDENNGNIHLLRTTDKHKTRKALKISRRVLKKKPTVHYWCSKLSEQVLFSAFIKTFLDCKLYAKSGSRTRYVLP